MLPATVKPTREEHKLLMAALQDKINGVMTQEELDNICYKWTYEYAWKDFEWIPLPTVPMKIREWWSMGDRVKKGLDDSTRQFFVELCRGFQSTWAKAYYDNMSQLHWLHQMEKRFTKTNDKRLLEVRKKIYDYDTRSKGIRRVAKRPS